MLYIIYSIILAVLIMFASSEAFDLRSISSIELSDSGLVESRIDHSLESIVLEPEDISETIKELILEQKCKNFISKTEAFYQPTTIRRCHSASLIHHKRQNLTLPYQLQRILHNSRKCPNIATDDLRDSIYGAFFGFIIGDVVGAHLAYNLYNIPEIPAALLMNGGGTYNIGPGQGTDQTQIMLSTCYGLLEGGSSYNPDHMAKTYLKWLESKPFNVSAIFILSFVQIRRKRALEKTTSFEGLGQSLLKFSEKNKNQESNLGLIRILPLVVWSLNLSEREFSKLIRDQMALICPNPLVAETALIYALILRTIFKTRDHQLAFYQASKWVYSRGSEKLRELWRYVQLDVQIQSRGNIGKLKTSFTYACIEINKREVKFMDSLLKTLVKGGDTDANAAIVMALVGSIVGYNSIPAYFKQKITNSRMSQSCRPRNDQYTPYHIIQIVQQLMKNQPEKYLKETSTTANSTII